MHIIYTWLFFGLYNGNSHRKNALFVTTPAVNEIARLPIKLAPNNGLRLDVNRAFEYRSNPVFTDIRPRNHLTV